MNLIVFLLLVKAIITINFKFAHSQCGFGPIQPIKAVKGIKSYFRPSDYDYLQKDHPLYSSDIFGGQSGASSSEDEEKKAAFNKQLEFLLSVLLAKLNSPTQHTTAMPTYIVAGAPAPASDPGAPAPAPAPAPAQASKPKQKCNTGFTKLGNICYLFSQEKLSWKSAVKDCKKEKAELAHPMNRKEWKKLESHVKKNDEIQDIESWWLGATDSENEKEWIWAHDDSDVHDSYTAWFNGQPDNKGGNENCLEIRKVFQYKWNDANCTLKQNYICQQK